MCSVLKSSSVFEMSLQHRLAHGEHHNMAPPLYGVRLSWCGVIGEGGNGSAKTQLIALAFGRVAKNVFFFRIFGCLLDCSDCSTPLYQVYLRWRIWQKRETYAERTHKQTDRVQYRTSAKKANLAQHLVAWI